MNKFKKIIEVLNNWECVESYTVHKKPHIYEIEIIFVDGRKRSWFI